MALVRKNAQNKKTGRPIEDELFMRYPVYEIPELDESGNWPKVRTRSIVPTVDDNPLELDDTSEGSLQREDSLRGKKGVVMYIQNRQELGVGVPETLVGRNVSPKKPRVLTWSTPINTTMSSKELELCLKGKPKGIMKMNIIRPAVRQ